jgi:hypothetical protein
LCLGNSQKTIQIIKDLSIKHNEKGLEFQGLFYHFNGIIYNLYKTDLTAFTMRSTLGKYASTNVGAYGKLVSMLVTLCTGASK